LTAHANLLNSDSASVRRVEPRRPALVLRDGGGEAGAGGAFGRQKIRGAIMEAIGRM
jgi:hypothetical protein